MTLFYFYLSNEQAKLRKLSFLLFLPYEFVVRYPIEKFFNWFKIGSENKTSSSTDDNHLYKNIVYVGKGQAGKGDLIDSSNSIMTHE